MLLPCAATPFGLRVRAALRQRGMLGMFAYPDAQRLKAVPDGPALRQFLTDRGWGPYGAPDGGWPFLDGAVAWLCARYGWAAPAPASDPLAHALPDEAGLDAALRDLAEQSQAALQYGYAWG